ncbi:Imm3 family immunity protein [Paenibacillus sp. FSL P2-0136]|uniref:Imm3 family immunity protein n=1 Tax=unclassified Paenibacillus TaxID=185978 RepID=UPI0030D6F19A
MDDWEYEELFEAVNRNYNNYLEQNLSDQLALARTSYDFETVRKEGILEDIIVSTAMGEIILSHQKVFIGNLNSIEELLINYNPNELSGLISIEDLTDLTTRINNVLISLKELPVDYNSFIRDK